MDLHYASGWRDRNDYLHESECCIRRLRQHHCGIECSFDSNREFDHRELFGFRNYDRSSGLEQQHHRRDPRERCLRSDRDQQRNAESSRGRIQYHLYANHHEQRSGQLQLGYIHRSDAGKYNVCFRRSRDHRWWNLDLPSARSNFLFKFKRRGGLDRNDHGSLQGSCRHGCGNDHHRYGHRRNHNARHEPRRQLRHGEDRSCFGHPG